VVRTPWANPLDEHRVTVASIDVAEYASGYSGSPRRWLRRSAANRFVHRGRTSWSANSGKVAAGTYSEV